MEHLSGVTIVVLKNPHPEAQVPQVIVDAYLGVRLKPALFLEAGKKQDYPNGAYMISVKEIQRAFAEQRPDAYRAHVALWGDICATVEESGGDILLPFSVECCERCGTVQ